MQEVCQAVNDAVILVTFFDMSIAALENQALDLANHEAWLDAQIRRLECTLQDQNDEWNNPEATLDEQRLELEGMVDNLKTELAIAASVEAVRAKHENRRLVQKLSEETAALKEASESQQSSSYRKMAHRTEEELKSVTIKYNIASNVLQGLILESGVDWASDPHLLDVMLKLDGLPE
ncbi:hypothetical protein BGW42_007011 [Actinomortierella wolfii]|nr:hypothetical protein BGW42_007011 [Actinomortierella wolfii]